MTRTQHTPPPPASRFPRIAPAMTTALLPQALIIGVMLGGFLWSGPTGPTVTGAPASISPAMP
ncbi:hypothetical protein [Thiobaca trueperi]|uniref:Uncharacterized protein n=1 Tax=Thiobaca trueperi TaxID=127458 RepID=A0A4R3N9V1_9GAMM|nr:hypothetical protein [Thiobaca trueperi]TCT23779.1 hypothetical protein EDC35_10192 [Thiobaca trueperi]